MKPTTGKRQPRHHQECFGLTLPGFLAIACCRQLAQTRCQARLNNSKQDGILGLRILGLLEIPSWLTSIIRFSQ